MAENTYTELSIGQRIKAYVALSKPRLSFIVVLSAISGYLLAGWSNGTILDFILLIIGGYLVTSSSNGFNQVIEKDLDKKMKRTKDRPLAREILSVKEAIIACIIFGIVGVSLLYLINPLTASLGFLSLFLYAAIYTPLKRITPWAVFVGAFPGAMPPLLGWVAVTGVFGLEPGVLYFVQFMWQFPHFWAIAWVLNDDYALAGFSLLPSKAGRDKTSAFLILAYTALMLPVSLLPWTLPIDQPLIGDVAAIIVSLSFLIFIIPAVKFYRTRDIKDAKKVMFASFIYLPIVQFVYLIN